MASYTHVNAVCACANISAPSGAGLQKLVSSRNYSKLFRSTLINKCQFDLDRFTALL